MDELITLALVIVLVLLPVGLIARPINRVAWRVERGLSVAAAMIIMGAMLFVSAEVSVRLVLNAPIPGHLELSELLLPAIIFLALPYTQATGGHVRMTLVVDRLGTGSRRRLEILAKALSLAIYALLAYYSGEHAWRAWTVQDTTMSPPYFLIWPSAAMVPLGMAFVTLRLYLELVHLVVPAWLPASEPGMGSVTAD